MTRMITQILTIGAISTNLLFSASSSPTVIEWLEGIHFVPPPITPIVVVNPFLCRDCTRRMVCIIMCVGLGEIDSLRSLFIILTDEQEIDIGISNV